MEKINFRLDFEYVSWLCLVRQKCVKMQGALKWLFRIRKEILNGSESSYWYEFRKVLLQLTPLCVCFVWVQSFIRNYSSQKLFYPDTALVLNLQCILKFNHGASVFAISSSWWTNFWTIELQRYRMLQKNK